MSDRELKTGISRVRWCNPAAGSYVLESAVLPVVMTDSEAREVSWFDELFNGGIKLPVQEGGRKHALTLLISGPPGTGKSTLTFELCIRLADREENHAILPRKMLYIASEADPEWMINNAKSFGWLGKVPVKKKKETKEEEDRRTSAENARDFKADALFKKGLDSSAKSAESRITLCKLSDAIREKTGFFPLLTSLLGLSKNLKQKPPISPSDYDVVVIDSLNTVGPKKAEAYENFYSAFIESGPKLIIFVVDSTQSPSVAESWEFGADIVVRLDKDYSSGYMVRTLEVVKARYQSHVWGKNTLKIHEALKKEDVPERLPTGDELEERLRAHPWMEGGVFIFPSIHYILSRFKRAAPVSPEGTAIKTPLASLTRLLGSGIPAGYTTALIGTRGGHKSHLGHLQALYNVYKLKGRSIIVSLRDGDAIVRSALQDYILKEQWADSEDGSKSLLDGLLNCGSLEILTYMPGYVTPEEFFHRMLLSIYRMRKEEPGHNIVLIFNSLDQIASRFPLCAKERVFIPGIIQTLSSLGVTSIFIGADTEESDESLRNLLSMAELIVRMERVGRFKHEKLAQILRNADEESLAPAETRLEKLGTLKTEKEYGITELTVERYAGGKPAGLKGMLELVTPQSPFDGILKPGLQFVPYRSLLPGIGQGD